jgi:hypothetical protein
MNKQKSLKDLSEDLSKVTETLDALIRRSLYEDPPDLSFEQKVIAAAFQLDEGHPLRDFLTQEEIERAIGVLADVYVATGVQMPDDWY